MTGCSRQVKKKLDRKKDNNPSKITRQKFKSEM